MARRWTENEINIIKDLYQSRTDAEIAKILDRSEDAIKRLARELKLFRSTQIESLDGEIWKDIDGYEGYYQISNKGRVKSLPRWIMYSDGREYFYDGVLLKQAPDKHGYLQAVLTINSELTTQKIHRMVAKAFIPNPEELPQVNHKDENKKNNCVENLEWCDGDYNIHYGTALQRAHENNIQTNPITLTNIKTGEKRRFERIIDAAKELNIDPSSIYKCLKDKLKKVKGYTIEYG